MRVLRYIKFALVAILALLVVAMIALYIYQPSPPDHFSFSDKGETLRLPDGRQLAWTESGDPAGRPVFYFHGGPGSRIEAQLYDAANKELGIRMIALDRPGYGRSDFQPGRSYLDWAGDVGAVADKLGIKRFAVIGFSSGGTYAALVAHEMPERLSVAAIVAGEGPYMHPDYPWSALDEHSFGVSPINRIFMFSAKYSPFVMRSFFRLMRIMVFADPVGMMQNSGGDMLSDHDLEMFTSDEYALAQVEAFRQGALGVTHDFALERRHWPFALEDIHAPEVLVFHGQDDGGVDPAVGAFVCGRIPACDEVVMFPGEGHSVIYHNYNEIAGAILSAWKN